jgi:hypothetical protein
MRLASRVKALVIVTVELAAVAFRAAVAFDIVIMLACIIIGARQFYVRIPGTEIAFRVIAAVFHSDFLT